MVIITPNPLYRLCNRLSNFFSHLTVIVEQYVDLEVIEPFKSTSQGTSWRSKTVSGYTSSLVLV